MGATTCVRSIFGDDSIGLAVGRWVAAASSWLTAGDCRASAGALSCSRCASDRSCASRGSACAGGACAGAGSSGSMTASTWPTLTCALSPANAWRTRPAALA